MAALKSISIEELKGMTAHKLGELDSEKLVLSEEGKAIAVLMPYSQYQNIKQTLTTVYEEIKTLAAEVAELVRARNGVPIQ